jgi:hypothetical protein
MSGRCMCAGAAGLMAVAAAFAMLLRGRRG